ncbi:hypothetical protein CQ018_13710 [Arthrobacter sp. MYb227]|uniref:hypothetical protein n=1 Tax=Arthrobacter sp. MYb227 TaxID=1848601 RepID=UPI000CFDDAD5|nr:hypothetical protein [Arthrobacter sp. MYb227]PQZ91681.1 hypothetical protein CQ018_13710 [Arthrobacter sp. MYb227]
MNSLHSNHENSADAGKRVTATLHDIRLTDTSGEVNLWTDWAHGYGTFPAEYLPEVIKALRAVLPTRQRVIVTLHDSGTKNELISLWTDWAHGDGIFPIEYLPEVIQALEQLQSSSDENKAQELNIANDIGERREHDNEA